MSVDVCVCPWMSAGVCGCLAMSVGVCGRLWMSVDVRRRPCSLHNLTLPPPPHRPPPRHRSHAHDLPHRRHRCGPEGNWRRQQTGTDDGDEGGEGSYSAGCDANDCYDNRIGVSNNDVVGDDDADADDADEVDGKVEIAGTKMITVFKVTMLMMLRARFRMGTAAIMMKGLAGARMTRENGR
eukprot:6194184-Pyramimonas_sp.AAC.2